MKQLTKEQILGQIKGLKRQHLARHLMLQINGVRNILKTHHILLL